MSPISRPLLIYTCVIALHSVFGIHVSVSPSSSECFSVEAERYKQGISFNYEVLNGVAEALNVDLSDGVGNNIYANVGGSGEFVQPVGNGGMYSVCFKNMISHVGDIVVGFSFHADDPTHEVLSNADATMIKHAQELEDLVYELTASLDIVRDTHAYMKSIKNYHNQIIDSTHARILWWTCAEAFILISLAIWQISFLRRTLEVRRLL